MSSVARQSAGGGVQSVDRALQILDALEAVGGEAALGDIASSLELPLPTVHRLSRTLVAAGYLRQLPDRRYTLGTRLIPLGNRALASFGRRSTPLLAGIVRQLGETVNLATLDGDYLVYVGQVASPRALRLFTAIGDRVTAHNRAAGKALLAELADTQVRDLLNRTGMPASTEHTITDPDEFIAELATVRDQGFALEDGEMEDGVICLAVPVASRVSPMALSISAPAARMTDSLKERAVPLLKQVAYQVALELDSDED
jgi:IclR family acetate operon transcriptional repressor